MKKGCTRSKCRKHKSRVTMESLPQENPTRTSLVTFACVLMGSKSSDDISRRFRRLTSAGKCCMQRAFAASGCTFCSCQWRLRFCAEFRFVPFFFAPFYLFVLFRNSFECPVVFKPGLAHVDVNDFIHNRTRVAMPFHSIHWFALLLLIF